MQPVFLSSRSNPASSRSVSDLNIEQALNINMIYHLPGVDPQKKVW